MNGLVDGAGTSQQKAPTVFLCGVCMCLQMHPSASVVFLPDSLHVQVDWRLQILTPQCEVKSEWCVCSVMDRRSAHGGFPPFSLHVSWR